MSIPTKEQANRFLLPLRGSVSVLVLHDVESKLPLSRFILRCASLHSLETTVLDTDAFYSANMDQLEDYSPMPSGQVLLLPERDFEVDSLLSLLSSKAGLLIIDDLNSLYSLALDTRRSQQLSVLFKLLSYNARINDSWVLSTAFRTELAQEKRGTGRRFLTALGDLAIDAEFLEGSVHLKGSLSLWPNGEYSL